MQDFFSNTTLLFCLLVGGLSFDILHTNPEDDPRDSPARLCTMHKILYVSKRVV